MKKFAWLLLLPLPLIHSCECERHQCPAFPDNTWLPVSRASYRNASSSSDVIVLNTTQRKLSEQYGKDETVLSFSCQSNDCVATADFQAATTAGTRNLTLQLHYINDYQGKIQGETRLHYTLNDMEADFIAAPAIHPITTTNIQGWYADSIRSVNTGLTVYPEVLIQTRKPIGNNNAVVKTYWCLRGELIGFAFEDGTTYWIK